MTLDDDTTLSSKKPGHRIKGFFKALGGSSARDIKKPEAAKNPEAAPPKPVEVVKEEPVVAEPEPVVELEAADKSAAYVDDNDGSKGGPCAACEGCVIL